MKLAKRTRVFLALPCYGGLVHTQNFLSYLAVLMRDPDPNLELVFSVQSHESLISRGRSTLASIFLDESDCDYLLSIDADVGFPRDAIARLIAHDRDLVIAGCPTKALPVWYAIRLLQPPCREGALVELQYASSAFCLVKRGVFEAVRAAFPELAYHHNIYSADGRGARVGKPMTGFYLPAIKPDGAIRELLSEDWAFSDRARQLGFRIWLDPDIELGHVGAFEFRGSREQLHRQIETAGDAPARVG